MMSVAADADRPLREQTTMTTDTLHFSYRLLVLPGLLAAAMSVASPARAQIAVSANDNKVVNINGTVQVVPNAPPDTVAILDMKASPPKVIAEVQAPVSVVGPPLSVAITPDQSLALVTASMKIDPADATKQTPDNRVSVIDLKASPPAVIATLQAGAGASGVSINSAGNLALVSNRTAGTVSVFTIQGKTVTPTGTIDLGGVNAGGGHVAITPDGKMALVGRAGDHKISVLSIEGTKVEYTKRDISAGLRPAAVDIAPGGNFAVAGSLSQTGDVDSVTLIDLQAKPPRAIASLGVGQNVEGVKFSPTDGSLIAAVVQDGSNAPKESPFYNSGGKLVLVGIYGPNLRKLAEATVGRWPQGAAFSPDGTTILVGCMIEKEYWVFSYSSGQLKDTGQRIKMNGGPAAIRASEKQ
jgi:DNA-binding beta-propeller fold protein YncE